MRNGVSDGLKVAKHGLSNFDLANLLLKEVAEDGDDGDFKTPGPLVGAFSTVRRRHTLQKLVLIVSSLRPATLELSKTFAVSTKSDAFRFPFFELFGALDFLLEDLYEI